MNRFYAQILAALRSTKGAIDLASIMVGVLVIGIIGGIIAATVFSVIPWSQDEAAKGSLDAVRDAQAVYFTGGEGVTKYAADGGAGTTAVAASFTSASALATAAGAGKYLDYAGLVSENLIQESDSVAVLTNDDGTCYVSLSASATSRVFFGTNTGPDVAEYDADKSATDFCVDDGQIGDAIQDINLGNTGPGNGNGNGNGGNGGGGNTGGGGGGGGADESGISISATSPVTAFDSSAVDFTGNSRQAVRLVVETSNDGWYTTNSFPTLPIMQDVYAQAAADGSFDQRVEFGYPYDNQPQFQGALVGPGGERYPFVADRTAFRLGVIYLDGIANVSQFEIEPQLDVQFTDDSGVNCETALCDRIGMSDLMESLRGGYVEFTFNGARNTMEIPADLEIPNYRN